MGRCEPAFMAEDSICGSRNGTVEELTYTSEDVRGVTLKSLDEYGCFQGNKNDVFDPVCSRPEGCQLFSNNEDSVARPVTEQVSWSGLTRPLSNSNGDVTSPVDGSCAFPQELFSANLVDSSFGFVESVSVRNDLGSSDASERQPQLQEECGFPSSSNNGGTTTLLDGCPASSQTFGANLGDPGVSISTGDTCNQQLGTNYSVPEQKQQDECGFLLSNTNWVTTIPVNWCPTASQNLGAGIVDSGFGLEVSTFQRDASRNLLQDLDCTELEKNLQDQLGLVVSTSGRDSSLERQQDMGVSVPKQKRQDDGESSQFCSNKSDQVKQLCWTGDLGSYLAVPDLEEGWPLTYGSTVDSIVQMYDEAIDCSKPDYVGVPPEEAVTNPKEVVEQKCYSLVGTPASPSSQAMNIEEDISILMQQLLNIAPGFSGEESTPLQSPLALDIVSNDSSRRRAEPDLQQSDAFNNAVTCSSMIDSIDGADCEGKAYNKNYVSESNSPDDVRVLPRRSTRVSKLNEMNEAKMASSQLGKKVNNVSLPRRSSGFSCKIARKKRSSLCKLARSSKWGELGNMMEVFKQNDGILKRDSDPIQAQTLGSWKTSGCKGSKKKKSWAAENSQKPEGKPNALISRVNLKIKIGKHGDQSYLKVVPSEGASSLPRVETMINERLSESNCGTGMEVPQEASGVGMKHKFGEDVQPPSGSLEKPGTPFDVPVLDVHTAEKDSVSMVAQARSVADSSGDCHGVSSQIGTETLGKAGFDSPKAVLHPQNVMDSNMLLLNTKKGKRSGKVKGSQNPVGECCVMGERARGPRSLNKTRKLSKRQPQQKVEDGLDILNSTSQIGASNNSSNEGSFRESIPLSGLVDHGAHHEVLKIENGSQACELLSHDVRIKETGASEFSSSRTNHDLEKSSRDATDEEEKFTIFEVGQEENHPELGGSVNVPFVIEKDSVTSGPTELNELSTVANETSYNLVRNGAGKNLQPENISSSNSVFSGCEEQALPPQVAWVCCDNCHKWRCISAALADYLEETHCKWICKDNEDKAFGDCSIPQEKSNADINAELGISDASCEEEAYDRCPNYNAFECKQTAVPQEATWKLIKSNLFLHRSRKTQTIDEIMVCHCTPPPDGSSGCGDECLNRILNIECVKGTCPCGNLCSNQQFQKGQYSKLKCVRCGKKGYGLQLQEDVSEGQFLIEYVGEVLDLHAYEARQKAYAFKGQKHFYFMALNGSEVIDAGSKGNLGRFINHSCEPNCRTEKWMVNGEICIGLFAIRDIKKGEELTFDYNYVRVYGAAAKKCFCGSSLCQGYIGGDPLNAETIVQGDSDEEFPEPVMIDEDNIDGITSVTSFDGATQFANVPFQARDSKSELAIMGFETSLEKGYALAPSLPSAQPSSSPELSLKMNGGLSKSSSSVPLEVSVQSNAWMRKPPPSAQLVKVSLNKEDTSNKSSCKVQETASLTASTIKKCMINPVGINKSIFDTVEDKPNISKSHLRVKACRSASSTKKGKSTAYPVIANKTQVMTKPNKQMDGSIRSRFEGAEEKLNELLDKERGISKRKDASRRYLKLLVLTAASGDGGNGEAFQSARDLSIILDALMKTKSRTVLTDIINKNGLQMLHNILKQNRKDFNRIPILRKLLKVFEFLALKGILKLEHINGGPPHPGMESFTDSILALTRHSDVQVHQIARSFRDRWIPRYSRRFSHFDRDDSKLEPCSGPSSNSFVSSQKGWHDQGLRPPEIINCISSATVAPTPVETNTQEGSSLGSGKRTRKRKSRWDQPAEMKNNPPPAPNEGKIEPSPQKLEISEAVQDQPFDVNRGKNVGDVCVQSLPQNDEASAMVDGTENIPDVPPGFSFPSCSNGPAGPPSDGTVETGSLFPQIACPVSCGFEVKVAHPQERFLPFLHVSYGIPLPIVQQLGTLQTGATDCWSIAPGVAFHPFPPLPPYSCEKNNPLSSSSPYPMVVDGHGGVQQLGHCGAGHNMDQCIPSTSGARPDGSVTRENNQDDQVNGSLYAFGRMYAAQQNWNENADPRFPWRRNDLGVNGNSSRNRVYSAGVGHIGNAIWSHCSQGVNNGSENVSSSFHQHTQQQYQH